MIVSANWELCKGAPDIIKTMMAKELNDGTLMLVLGAGASASVGLPSWIDLVNKCIETCNADKKVSPAIEYIDHSYPLTTILKRTSRVKEHYSDHEYALLIKKSLYYQLS